MDKKFDGSTHFFSDLLIGGRHYHILADSSHILHKIVVLLDYAAFHLLFLSVCYFPQDIASAIDEEDVAKFTDVVKEFDSMTTLVRLYLILILLFLRNSIK